MKRSIIRTAEQIARSKNHIHPHQNGFRHYTFVVQNNKILELGMNRLTQPERTRGYKDFSGRHAELDAMYKARGIMDHNKPFEIINIRLNRRGELRLSKPCKVCDAWLRTTNCKTILYSTDDGFEVLNLGA